MWTQTQLYLTSGMCSDVTGRSAGAMHEQLHDDLCQEGRALISGRHGRRTEL